MIPEARGQEQHWIAQRLRIHRQPGEPVLRELPGGRWRRIVERRLSDGSLVSFSTDVTELVQREQRLATEIAAREAIQTQLRHANASLARLSGTDHLTGLANRREFERRLEQEWLRAARRGATLSVLMIDVDQFEAYNARHGQLQGDACLRALAEALAACARRAGDVPARHGDDTFALLLPDTNAREAAVVARQCLEAADALQLPHGAPLCAGCLSVSIGHASAQPTRDTTPSALLQGAERALCLAKRAGRHRVASAEEAQAWEETRPQPAPPGATNGC
jgi:diguanylate cyclase (GGDEF)-like protein